MRGFGRWQVFFLVLFVLSIGFTVYLFDTSVGLARNQVELARNQDLLAANASSLEAYVGQIQNQVGELKTQGEKARSDLKSALENLESNLTGKVDRQGEKVDTGLASLNKGMAAQGSDLRTLTTGFSDLKVANASLATKVTGAQSQLGTLSTKVDGLKVVDFNAVYGEKWPSVFMIETAGGQGSGFLIEAGLILTNAHVVEFYSNVTVRQSSSPPFAGLVLAVDRGRDIALIKFSPPSVSISPDAKPMALGQISTSDNARPLMALGFSGSGIKTDGTVGSAAANVGVLSQIIDFGSTYGLNLEMDAQLTLETAEG